MRVKILGMCGHLLDETSQWDETWGMAHDPEATRFHRVVEVHGPTWPAPARWSGSWVEQLRYIATYMPLYTPWGWGEKLGKHHEVISYQSLGVRQIESSIGYLFAIAMKLGATKIGVYGVDMAEGTEYAHQRPNLHYLIGMADARGIEVELHPDSTLFQSCFPSGWYGHPDDAQHFTQ